MPAIIAVLLRAIGWSLIPYGWKLLRGLGFAAFTYVGVSQVMEKALQMVWDKFGVLPPEYINVLGLLQIDVCMNVLFSAYIVRGVMWGMNKSGSKTTYRQVGPGA